MTDFFTHRTSGEDHSRARSSNSTPQYKRKPRRADHPRWEQLDAESSGLLESQAALLREKFFLLTSMESRIAVLVERNLKSVEIGQKLCINEHSVENYRSKLRTKLGLESKENLRCFIHNCFLQNSSENAA